MYQNWRPIFRDRSALEIADLSSKIGPHWKLQTYLWKFQQGTLCQVFFFLCPDYISVGWRRQKSRLQKTTLDTLQWECGDPGSDVSVIADLIFWNWGLIIADRGPAALGLQWTPISQNIGPQLPIRPRQGHRIVPVWTTTIQYNNKDRLKRRLVIATLLVV